MATSVNDAKAKYGTPNLRDLFAKPPLNSARLPASDSSTAIPAHRPDGACRWALNHYTRKRKFSGASTIAPQLKGDHERFAISEQGAHFNAPRLGEARYTSGTPQFSGANRGQQDHGGLSTQRAGGRQVRRCLAHTRSVNFFQQRIHDLVCRERRVRQPQMPVAYRHVQALQT